MIYPLSVDSILEGYRAKLNKPIEIVVKNDQKSLKTSNNAPKNCF